MPLRKLLIGVLLGLGASALTGALGRLSFARIVELKTYDQRVRWTADPSSVRDDLVLVQIDEDSIRRMEPLVGRWPWPRVVHADLLDYLAQAPAKVIAYDVLFTERDRRRGFDVGETEWTGEQSDAAFAESTARAGNVVHLADVTFEGTEGADQSAGDPNRTDAGSLELPGSLDLGPGMESRPGIRLPFPALADASHSIAHNFMVLDEDGPVRRVVPFVRVGNRDVPSLGVATALVAERLGPRDVAFDGQTLRVRGRDVPLLASVLPRFEGERGPPRESRRALINFRGPAVLPDGRTPTYPTYSFYRLFYSHQQMLAGEAPLVDPATFRNKIVFVGVTAAGLHDVFAGPFGASGQIAGIQLHANVVDDLLSGRFIRPASTWAALAALVCPAIVVGVASTLLSASAAGGVGLAAAASVGWLSVFLFGRGIWIWAAVPILAIAITVFAGISYQYFLEGREKRRVKALFSRYVSRDVYEQLLSNPGLARLGGQRRDMTVLFSDIRGFTSVSEAGQPEDVVSQLNEYFSTMVPVILARRGTIDKFVGDMIMALFGAPLDDEDHADHAVEAALAMGVALDTLNGVWKARGQPTLDIGVGINTGDMIAGNVGSDTIMSYTVIGDAVNLASRLESLNKEWATRIIISDATRLRLKRGYDIRPLGEVKVKGKSKSVLIHEVRPSAPALQNPKG